MVDAAPGGSGPPPDVDAAPPPSINAVQGQTKTIIDALEPKLVTAIRGAVTNRFIWLLSIFGGGFLILAGLTLSVYSRLDDKIDTSAQRLSSKIDSVNSNIEQNAVDLARLSQQLQDLLQRVPPVQQAIPVK